MHFDIYDFEGVGKVDAANLGDLCRSLDLRPTQALIEKSGGTKKKGQKMLTIEEFLPIYSQIKKDKDVGAFEDLLEGLKLYDKQENGTMMAAELAHVMLSLGELPLPRSWSFARFLSSFLSSSKARIRVLRTFSSWLLDSCFQNYFNFTPRIKYQTAN